MKRKKTIFSKKRRISLKFQYQIRDITLYHPWVLRNSRKQPYSPPPRSEYNLKQIWSNHKGFLTKSKAIGHRIEIGRIGAVPTTSEVSQVSRDLK